MTDNQCFVTWVGHDGVFRENDFGSIDEAEAFATSASELGGHCITVVDHEGSECCF